MSASWGINVGQLTTRIEVARTYGGSRFGGIQPCRESPNIMIYTDPEEGEQHGYIFDGWDPEDPSVFYYSGEGQTGDQRITKGNKAIAEHLVDGRALRVFEVASGDQPGGKLQRYVGEFVLDDIEPYRFEWAEDSSDPRGQRRIVVFKLHARTAESRRVSAAEPSRSVPPGARLVEPELNLVDTFDRSPIGGDIAHRREAEMMRRFESALQDAGHAVARIRIPLPDGHGSMVTDTFVKTTRTLWEIKASSDRATVRLALGQLMDYLRFTEPFGCRASGVVLPADPGDDLRKLIRSAGHLLVVDTGDAFVEWLAFEQDGKPSEGVRIFPQPASS
jgi:hypothetical protein